MPVSRLIPVASHRLFALRCVCVREGKKAVKEKLKILVSLGLVILETAIVSGCNRANMGNGVPTPPNPIDQKIDNYEKVTTEYVRVAKKLKSGDVSITVKYIELEAQAKQESVQLQQEAPNMTPQQAQRLADIAAKTAPYLKP